MHGDGLQAQRSMDDPTPAMSEPVDLTASVLVWRLTAATESHALLKRPFLLEWGPYVLDLHADEDDLLSEVVAQKTIPDIPENEPRLVVYKEKPPEKPDVRLGTKSSDANPHVQDLYALLQYFESLGGFWFGIDWVDWREPRMECVRVSASGERTTLMDWNVHSDYRAEPREIDAAQLAKVLAQRSEYEYLLIPLSFFREGKLDFESTAYINAFFNFYFFLEGLYGNGKWRGKPIADEFKKSRHVKDAIAETIRRLNEPEWERHRLNLDEFLRVSGKDFSVDGLIDFIVHLRGKLHHFSLKNTTIVGHPLNQSTFRTPAFVAMSICIQCCTRLVVGEKPQ